jgi:hypothetical protein
MVVLRIPPTPAGGPVLILKRVHVSASDPARMEWVNQPQRAKPSMIRSSSAAIAVSLYWEVLDEVEHAHVHVLVFLRSWMQGWAREFPGALDVIPVLKPS